MRARRWTDPSSCHTALLHTASRAYPLQGANTVWATLDQGSSLKRSGSLIECHECASLTSTCAKPYFQLAIYSAVALQKRLPQIPLGSAAISEGCHASQQELTAGFQLDFWCQETAGLRKRVRLAQWKHRVQEAVQLHCEGDVISVTPA